MLTKSHYAAQRLVRCGDKPVYRKHMCGLCHALGDDYGLPSRLLTNHDTILLNLLTSAQCEQDTDTVMRRCPLNPTRFVRTNQDVGSQFAAAVTVGLAAVSVDDDITDSGGRDLIARLACWMLTQPEQAAFQQLEALGFDTSMIQRLGERQSTAETTLEADPAAPSAAVGAALFTMTGRLAKASYNAPALATIGAQYGTYIYLADAYRDLQQDIHRGEFNPLRPFAQTTGQGVTLSVAGVTWLTERLEAVQSGIQAALGDLTLHRDRATVHYLLAMPTQDLLNTLTGQPRTERVCMLAGDKKRKRRHSSCDMCDGCDCCDCCDCGGRRGRDGCCDCDCDCCD